MKNRISFIVATIALALNTSLAQESFQHSIRLEAVASETVPGLHSYAFAQSNGLWLVIGGREDGIHARQPFNAFQTIGNNANVYVIDIVNDQVWSKSVAGLSADLSDQLQSTNMNFIQVDDTLYIVGGYGYSSSTASHRTFPFLTTVQVSGLINAVQQSGNISGFFKQIEDTAFAVTGGQLGYIDGSFYLVGGHRFDGRYNPHGPTHGPGFDQRYTSAYHTFAVNNGGSTPVVTDWVSTTNQQHLHRRDYNLVPMQYSDGFGYLISSGVFQIGVDEPFLYPVEIRPSGFTPITNFNQYLSNYHSAHASLYDSDQDEHYHIFFGGISQYYYDGEVLVKDDMVPFVKTISVLVRSHEGSYNELKLGVEMPALQGASAEFIVNPDLPLLMDELIDFQSIENDSILLGHIYGGIYSSMANAFQNNQTEFTAADASVYEVWLDRNVPSGATHLDGSNPYTMTVYPNPSAGEMRVQLNRKFDSAYYQIYDASGRMISMGKLDKSGKINLNAAQGTYFLTVIVDSYFFLTEPIVVRAEP